MADSNTGSAPISIAPENNPLTSEVESLQQQASSISGLAAPQYAPSSGTPAINLARQPVNTQPIGTPGTLRPATVTGTIAPSTMIPAFERISKQTQVPVNILMALANQESNYNPTSVNPDTNAGGMLQYLPSTAQQKGINPFNWQQSVQQAAQDFANRRAQGYSVPQAIAAHFGGDNQSAWGPKTQQYTQDVLKRAGDIRQAYLQRLDAQQQPAPTPDAPQPTTPTNDTPAPDTSLTGEFSRGFGQTFPETKGMAQAAVGLFGDWVSHFTGGTLGQGLRDWGYKGYRATEDAEQKNAQESDSLTSAISNAYNKGNYGGIVDFLAHGSGYMAGQAVQSIAAGIAGAAAGSVIPGAGTIGGGLTGLVSKGVAKKIIGNAVEQRVAALTAQNIAKGMAEDEAANLATKQLGQHVFGAAAGSVGFNVGQELGTTYGQARDQAQDDTNTANTAKSLTDLAARNIARQAFGSQAGAASTNPMAQPYPQADQGDYTPNGSSVSTGRLATATGAGVAAGLLDTAGEAVLFGNALHSAPNAVTGLRNYALTIAKAAGKDITSEAATEAAQTALERFGAGQTLTDWDAAKDYIDSAALGGLGGAHAGVASGILQSIRSPAKRIAAQAGVAASGNPPPNAGQNGGSPEPTAPAAPAAPVIDPAAPQATPSPSVTEPNAGPVTRATSAAAQSSRIADFAQMVAGGNAPQVNVSGTMSGNDIQGVLDHFQPTDNGGWQARVLGEDGQTYSFTDRDGVTIAPTMPAQPDESQEAAPNIAPEPLEDINAQVRAVYDPSTTKDIMLIPPGSPMTTEDVGMLHVIPTKQGTFVTSSDQKAIYAHQHADTLSTGQASTLLGYAAPKDQSDGTIIQARTPDGAIAHQELTSPASMGQAFVNAKANAPKGSTVEVTSAEDALRDRANRSMTEYDEPVPTDEDRKRAAKINSQTFRGAARKLITERNATDDPDLVPLVRAAEKAHETGDIDDFRSMQTLADYVNTAHGSDFAEKLLSNLVNPDSHVRFMPATQPISRMSEAQARARLYGVNQEVNRRGWWNDALRLEREGLEKHISVLGEKNANATDDVGPEGARAGSDKGTGRSEDDNTTGREEGKASPAPSEQDRGKPAEEPQPSIRHGVSDTTEPGDDKATVEDKTAGKWFGTEAKARAWLEKNGYAATHTVEEDGKRFNIVPKPSHKTVEQAAAEAATSPENNKPEPTEAQKEAGNYAKGHIVIDGVDISIENPAGSHRRPEWPPLTLAYGYFKGTLGHDGDHVDVFLSPDARDTSLPVFVVNQRDPATGKFDEHKVMMGFKTAKDARAGYLSNYEPGWKGLASIRKMYWPEFRHWILEKTPAAKEAATQRKQKSNAAQQSIMAERAENYQIGNIVPAMGEGAKEGNIDKVIAFDPGRKKDGLGWSVTVQQVKKDMNGDWQPVPGAKPRTHSADLLPNQEPIESPQVLTRKFGEKVNELAAIVAEQKQASEQEKAKTLTPAPDKAGIFRTVTGAQPDAPRVFRAYIATTGHTGHTGLIVARGFDNSDMALDAAEKELQPDERIALVSALPSAAYDDWAAKNLSAFTEMAEKNLANPEPEPQETLHGTKPTGFVTSASKGKDGITVFEIDPSKFGAKAAPATKSENAEVLSTEAQFAGNKVFTADKYAAARKRLMQKRGNLNSGFDPELMLDVMTVAGAHIESGLRKFTPYAEAMVRDLGDWIKPYLLGAYNSVRDYPGIDASDMDNDEQARAASSAFIGADTLPQQDAEQMHPDPSIGSVDPVAAPPAGRKKKTGSGAQFILPSDYGVQNIDGWTELPGVKGIDTDNGLTNGVKSRFIKDAKKYLAEVSSQLAQAGLTPAKSRSRNRFGVNVNEGGPAVSGDVNLSMDRPDGKSGIEVTIGVSALRGVVPTTANGVSILYRNTVDGRPQQNHWAAVDMTAQTFADHIAAKLDQEAAHASTRHAAGKGNPAATHAAVPSRDIPAPAATGGARDNAGTPHVAGSGDGAGGTGSGAIQPIAGGGKELRAEPAETSGANQSDDSGYTAGGATAGNRRDRRDAEQSATKRHNEQPISDYRYGAGELNRTDGWKSVAERNVQAVEIIRKVEAENRMATPEEREILARYTGWGASELANSIFPNPKTHRVKDGWEDLSFRLKSALTPEEYRTASQSTRFAHYTSEAVIRSIYNGLERLGFNGGRVLEPGMGIGLFKGLMPAAMSNHSSYVGIEFDGITAAIARQLYPQSTVKHEDFTKSKLPHNFFDAAIGNPPFAQDTITSDPEYRKNRFLLHDYFFAKTLDRVRLGGVMVFVTSKGTMDKANVKARQYLAERANLLGAIRLPQTAFKQNAGTEVVTDVLFLQKRGPGIPENGTAWLNVAPITADGHEFHINQYFVQHPEMVLGKHAATGSMYRANEYTVTPNKTDIEADFAKAVLNLPQDVFRPDLATQEQSVVAKVQAQDFNPAVKKEGSIYLGEDGALMQRRDGVGVPLTHRINKSGKEIALGKREIAFLRSYVGLRDTLKTAQSDQLNDGPWEQSLSVLQQTYRDFVADHGNILAFTRIERTNDQGEGVSYPRFKNSSILRLDPENALVMALEQINPDDTISTTDMLDKRVLDKPQKPTINSVQDALLVSLNSIGKLNMADVAKLAGVTERQAIAELGDIIYQHPSGEWETADAYLSGNVVRKLAEAREASRLSSDFNRNVAALEAVQPVPLAPRDISVHPGVHWMPADIVKQFAQEVMNSEFGIKFEPSTKIWEVEGSDFVISDWGVDKLPAPRLLSAVLNNRMINIRSSVSDGNGKTISVPDIEMTEAANQIAAKIQSEFKRWIWADEDRTDRLVNYYNEHFNNIVPRQFNGDHLTLPGTSALVSFHPHQKRAVWRAIQQGNTYFAHAVGAGKTFEMIAAGMEQRRLGLIKKPVFAVPNHMLAQFSREFMQLYPAAHIMVADEEDFHTTRRHEFVARAALNNPDAIIMTHSSFERIPLSDEFLADYMNKQIADYQETLESLDDKQSPSFKQVQGTIKRMEERLKSLLNAERKDNVITFEDMGADQIIVDEFHEFRKLSFSTNRGNVKGIDPNGSQRAMDLHMKVQYLETINPGRSLIAASGTPVTNTIGELYTVQRFMAPQQLAEDGTDTFDSWANQYGQVTDGLEADASGQYKVVSRFSRFMNVPELMARVRSFMDILTAKQLGHLVQKPEINGGGRQIIVVPQPEGYSEFLSQLRSRIETIKNRRGPPKPGQDIMLNVIGDGRLSAIDMRFIDPTRGSDPQSKLNFVMDRLAQRYKDTAHYEYMTDGKPDPIPGASLMLFSNLGLGAQSAKTRGFDMRQAIEDGLVERGISREHIAFIQDYKTSAKKEKMFSDMRQGVKRVLIGGSGMETGTNVQKRLVWLGHLDSVWFPATVEQREGRIDRQGNQNPNVDIEAFATKGSYDSTMWGMTASKQRFISQAFDGDASVRSMEDVSEASSFEMAAALSSGDPRYLQLAGLRSDVDRLSRLYSAHIRAAKTARGRVVSNQQRAESLAKRIDELKAYLTKVKPVGTGDQFRATVAGIEQTSRDDFSNALLDTFQKMASNEVTGSRKVGNIGGIDVMYDGYIQPGSGNFLGAVSLEIPGAESLIEWPIDSGLSVRGIAMRAVNQLTSIEKRIEKAQTERADALADARVLERRATAKFPEMSELQEKQEQLDDLEAELASDQSDLNDAQDEAAATEETGGDDRVSTVTPDATSGPFDVLPDIPNSFIEAAGDDALRVRTLSRLKQLQQKRADGKLDDEQFIKAVERLTGAIQTVKDEQASKRSQKERVRGADYVQERLLRARRLDQISPEQADFALWLLHNNPDIADDLGISIRQGGPQNTGSAGFYIPAQRVMTLFENGGAGKPTTAVHEIMHHVERMLPPDIQAHITKAWQQAFVAALAKAKDSQKSALLDMRMAALGDRAAYARVMRAFRDGILNVADHYRLVNSSEFWAETASSLFQKRYAAGNDWVRRARVWISNMIEHLRGLLGLPSNAPVLRGMRAVLNGNGTAMSPDMLAEQWRKDVAANPAANGLLYRDMTGGDDTGAYDPDADHTILPEGRRYPRDAGSIRDALSNGFLGASAAHLFQNGRIKVEDTVPDNAPVGADAWTDKSGVIHLKSDMSPQLAEGKLLHEMFHAGVSPLIGSKAWTKTLTALETIYSRARSGSGALNQFWKDANKRLQLANEAGDQNANPTSTIAVQEFGAYAIEEYANAPPSVRKWVDSMTGAVKAWALQKWGAQIGAINPAQLTALSRSAIEAGAQTDRALLYANMTDRTLYSAAQRQEALNGAMEDLQEASDDIVGPPIPHDLSGMAKYWATPRHIASLYRPFAPVFQAVIDRMARRDRIVNNLNIDYQHYAALPAESKAKVNKVLELGRLMGTTYNAAELMEGHVRNEGRRPVMVVGPDGRPVRSYKEIKAALTSVGETVQLTHQEAEAYAHARVMFDRALDMMRDRMLHELGFGEFAGNPEALRERINEIRKTTPHIPQDMQRAAQIVDDFEQAKRAGYVPFSRFGQYVVAVKRDKAPLTIIRHPRDQGMWLARNIPADMDDFMNHIGAQWDDLEGGYILSKVQKKMVQDENSETLYSEKVELSARDKVAVAKGRLTGASPMTIPSVKAAYDRIQKEWAPEGSGARMVAPFAVSTKRPDSRVSLNDIDTLADLAQIPTEQWDEIRDKLADAIQSLSFRRHFFNSDNIPGYSTDFERSMTDYMGGTAGYLARREFQQIIDTALNNIEDGKLHDYATSYVKYTDTPQEEFAMVRQLGFLYYIAGNIASGVTNLTQLGLMTYPTFSQFAGQAKVISEMSRAFVDATKMMTLSRDVGLNLFDPQKAPEDVRADLMDASNSGEFIPTATFEIMATANQRNTGARKVRRNFERLLQGVGLTFSVPERLNRLTTYIAMHRLSRDPEVKRAILKTYGANKLAALNIEGDNYTPNNVANFMVDETQFRMGKANRAAITRGWALPIFQFKSFMMMSLETYWRMVAQQGPQGRAGAFISLAIMVGMAGIWGFPGGDDLRKLLEMFLGEIENKDVDLRTMLRTGLFNMTGNQWVAAAASRGAPYASGLDLGRVGMGNVAPDSDSITDLLGIPYDLFVKHLGKGLSDTYRGNFMSAMADVSPKFLANFEQAWQMRTEGLMDARGRMILTPQDLSMADAMQKAFGFTTPKVTDIRDYNYAENRMQHAVDARKQEYIMQVAHLLGGLSRENDPQTKAKLQKQLTQTMADMQAYNRSVPTEQRINVAPRTLKLAAYKQRTGLKGAFGRESKQARGAAEGLRGAFTLPK